MGRKVKYKEFLPCGEEFKNIMQLQEPGAMAHAYNSNTWKAEPRGLGVHTKFRENLGGEGKRGSRVEDEIKDNNFRIIDLALQLEHLLLLHVTEVQFLTPTHIPNSRGSEACAPGTCMMHIHT